MMTFLAVDYSDNSWIALGVYGLIAGTLIASFTKGKGFGVLGNIVVGMVGAILGAGVYQMIRDNLPTGYALGQFTLDFNQLAIALLGALLFLVIVSFLGKRKKK